MVLNKMREAQDTRVQRAWYEAPRPGEGDYWYRLAQDYNRLAKLLPEPAGNPQPPDNQPRQLFADRDSPEFVRCTDWRAFYGTTLPALQQLLLARSATIEFAFLWGRFCAAAAGFVGEAASAGGPAELSDALLKRRGPLKWYLHWRRYYESRGFSMHRANSDFLAIAHDIVSGVRPAPPGFCPSWFQGALCRGENKMPRRALPHIFKRANKLACASQLLKGRPDEEPRIPPLGLAAYSTPQ